MTRESWLTFRSLLLLSISILCWLALPSPARAQAVAIAQVSGNVTDPTGSAIANAQVRMIDTEKQSVRTTVTDAQGQYVLPGLPVGPYRLEVQVAGFKDYAQTGIVLQVNNNVQINVAMQVGSLRKSGSERHREHGGD
jgi:Carboxypeptidase regulatory-like domain